MTLAYRSFQDSIKSILLQCITLAVKLKNEITNLVRFFKAMVVIVQFVAEKHVNPYIGVIARGGNDPGDSYKIGSYTLTDLQRSVSRISYFTNSANNSLSCVSTVSSPSDLTSRSLAILHPCGIGSLKCPSSQACVWSTRFPLSTQEETLA